MFASRVKAQAKAAETPTNRLLHECSTLVARPFGGSVEQAHLLHGAIGDQATPHYLTQMLSNLDSNGLDEQHVTEADRIARKAPNSSWDFSKIHILSPDQPEGRQAGGPRTALRPQGVLQPKLAAGESIDPLELEADRIAEQMTGTSTTAHVEPKIPAVVPAALQTRMAEHVSDERPGELSAGAPLELSVRARMEPRFGYDFSSVRVHTGAEAGRSARSFGALAYTLGRNVVFSNRRYAPHTSDGPLLLRRASWRTSCSSMPRKARRLRNLRPPLHVFRTSPRWTPSPMEKRCLRRATAARA